MGAGVAAGVLGVAKGAGVVGMFGTPAVEAVGMGAVVCVPIWLTAANVVWKLKGKLSTRMASSLWAFLYMERRRQIVVLHTNVTFLA